jgi:hypothetical protein
VAGVLGQPEVHQIAEIICRIAEFEGNRSGSHGSFRAAGPAGATELFGPGPERRLEAALAGQ